MYLFVKLRFWTVCVLLSCCWTTSVWAAATVVISPSGASSYSVQGTGMDGVAGIQLDITYDSSSLSAPVVTQGEFVSGAMFAANATRPGSIKIAIITTKPFSGSGQLASVVFTGKTGSYTLPVITSSLIDSKGLPIGSVASGPVAQELITTPGIPFSQASQQAGSVNTINNSVPVATPTILPGTVTLPQEQLQRGDSPKMSEVSASGNASEPVPVNSGIEPAKPPAVTPVEAQPEVTPQYIIYKGVLDRFRQYNLEKSLPVMVALFERNVARIIRQEPAILVSDGQHKSILTADIPYTAAKPPRVSVTGGTLVSIEQEKQTKGRWKIAVSPEVGTVEVTVVIMYGADGLEYPLTVIPPIKGGLTFDERNWDKFLKEVGTDAAPLHDFNNDGVRDYLDEYIFIANYIMGKSAPVKPVSPVSKPAQRRK